MTMTTRALIWILGLALANAASAGLQPFDADAFDAIRARYASEPVLLLLWSLDCHHCKAGMARAAEHLAEQPELNLVLVNVDASEDAQAVAHTLQALGLADADNWQFIDAPAARLRASIDPQWYGELPRSYLIDGNGHLEGFSGRLTPEFFDHWHHLNRAVRAELVPR